MRHCRGQGIELAARLVTQLVEHADEGLGQQHDYCQDEDNR
jgi:hypothetical protein